jgi:S-adenosylmethionine hydrolase
MICLIIAFRRRLCLTGLLPLFPHQTIFLTVIDPGAGSERRLLLARSDRYSFIGPDNGLLSPVIEAEKAEVLEITGEKYFLTSRRTSLKAGIKWRRWQPGSAWNRFIRTGQAG